jgi:hypothetical protein
LLESAEREYGYPGRVSFGETNDVCEIATQICLVEQDDGAGPALMRKDEVAFKTARVVVAIESADDEQDIHVRGEYLLTHAPACFLAGKLRAPGQDLGDDASLSQDDPVADAGRVVVKMTKVAADGCQDFAGCCPDDVVVAMDQCHAAVCGIRRCVGRKVRPACFFEIHV